MSVVAITGASAGVGRATARAFAAKGYDVALLARGLDGFEAAQRSLTKHRSLAVAALAAIATFAGYRFARA